MRQRHHKVAVLCLILIGLAGCSSLGDVARDARRILELQSHIAQNLVEVYQQLDLALDGRDEEMDPVIRARLLELTELITGLTGWSLTYEIVKRIGRRPPGPARPMVASAQPIDAVGFRLWCLEQPAGTCYDEAELRFADTSHLGPKEQALVRLMLANAESVTAWLAERCYLGACRPRGPLAGELQGEVQDLGGRVATGEQIWRRGVIRWHGVLVSQLERERNGLRVARFKLDRSIKGSPWIYSLHSTRGPAVFLLAALADAGVEADWEPYYE